MRAKIAHHGEKPGGIWTTINTEKKPRDLIPRLRIPNNEPPQYKRSSGRMAELAKNYHENLQHARIDDKDEIECETKIEEALTYLPEEQLLEDLIQTEMFWTVETAQVEKAIKLSKTGSSTGIDGCPYEL